MTDEERAAFWELLEAFANEGLFPGSRKDLARTEALRLLRGEPPPSAASPELYRLKARLLEIGGWTSLSPSLLEVFAPIQDGTAWKWKRMSFKRFGHETSEDVTLRGLTSALQAWAGDFDV